jgi:hypothetical protein
MSLGFSGKNIYIYRAQQVAVLIINFNTTIYKQEMKKNKEELSELPTICRV